MERLVEGAAVFGLDLLRLIDARIESARDRATATGTVQERQSATRAAVTFDGSALAVPVKVLTHVQVRENSRVTLVRFGSEWVVVGVFGGAGNLVRTWTASTSSSGVSGETAVLAVTDLTVEAQAVYRLRLGGQIQSSAAGHSLWRVRDRVTGPYPVDWGLFGHYSTPVAGIAFGILAEHYLARTATTPLEGQTIAVTAQASTGTVQHIGTATKRRYLEVERMPGTPADYPHATVI
ncbi:flagellar biosynthetic protein FliO [Micromonospora lupini]|uniref:flagellar biosynthetic protein FliO n=1 Tax=Micromonospora lupini TaxID=285679 RepID=UPI0022538128|nr:flagellar biosynthetic protein FliO [Micromonospora lupini]MCX5066670.1 flagellar biosynthetic protein FliO [Micromonospora lupini]